MYFRLIKEDKCKIQSLNYMIKHPTHELRHILHQKNNLNSENIYDILETTLLEREQV